MNKSKFMSLDFRRKKNRGGYCKKQNLRGK